MNNNYITLSNKVNIPTIGLGTYKLNGKDCINAVISAYSLGYRLFDTAKLYNNEHEIGVALNTLNINRSEIFLVTKLDSNYKTYDDAKKAINESLINLNTSYLDLVLIHEPHKYDIEVYNALEDLYDEGIIKSLGVSNYNYSELKDFINKVRIKPMINQVELHPYCQQKELRSFLKTQDIVLMSYAPFTSNMTNIIKDDILVNIAKKYNKTVHQVILNYLSNLNLILIPRSKNYSNLKENLNSFDFKLTDDDMKLIKNLDRNISYFGWN